MGPIAKAVSKKHTLKGHHGAVWYYWMPDGEYMPHRRNLVNEDRAYRHIAERIRVSELDQKSINPLYPNATEGRHILLAFLGLDD